MTLSTVCARGKTGRWRTARLTAVAASAALGLLRLAAAGAAPAHAATTTQFVYVTNFGGNTVEAYNAATATITVGSRPQFPAANPAGTRVYVPNKSSGTVSVIDTASNTVTATIPVGAAPTTVAVSPDGTTAYVTNFNDDTVSVISTATNIVTATIPVGSTPFGVAFSPNGATAYVANANDATVSVISTATNTVTATIPVGIFPDFLAVSPDGSALYVADGGNDAIYVISTATDTVTATIKVGGEAGTSVAVTPSGATVYAVNTGDGTVSAISTATNKITATFPVGSLPEGVAVNAAGTTAYTANNGDGTVTAINTATNATTSISGFPNAFGIVAVQVPSATPPAVTGVSPSHGPEAGGTQVTITGSGFTGATAVDFGATPATSFTVNSDTQITATAPAATSLGTVDVTVTTPAGTSATSPADQYAYVNPTGKVTADGRITAGGQDAELAFAAEVTQPGGTIKGHLEYDNQAAGVHIKQAAFTVFYLTSATSAHAEGTATCTIGGQTSGCTIAITATSPTTVSLTYNTTTVAGTLQAGHITVGPPPGGKATTARTPARHAGLAAAARAGDVPVAAAQTGTFSASLLGVSLTGGRCATAALISTGGAATGGLSCLLLGIAGINIDIELPAASGSTGTGTATLAGTATVTVAGLLPVTLPVTAVLTASGSGAGLKLTVNGITLPALPVGTGGIEIG